MPTRQRTAQSNTASPQTSPSPLEPALDARDKATLTALDARDRATLTALESIAASLALIAKKLPEWVAPRTPAPVSTSKTVESTPAAPTRTRRGRVAVVTAATGKPDLTRERLVELLAANGNSMAAVARASKYSVDTIRRKMRAFGLQSNGPGRLPKAKPAPTPPASARRARGASRPLAATPNGSMRSSEAQGLLAQLQRVLGQ